jgi:hypothetical protein
MVARTKDLWSLTSHNPHVDAADLAAAVEKQVVDRDLDYRSRLLIRDSVAALRGFWGEDKVSAWLTRIVVGLEIEFICRGPWDDDRGFSSLMRRVVDVTKAETIVQFLRELSRNVHQPTRLEIGGSAALILRDLLSRKSDDVVVVDEVPSEIRMQYKLLDDLTHRYGLSITHFQQHYLPSRWATRLRYFNTYGSLTVYLVDAYDVILSKLFSHRTKDLDDIRIVVGILNKDVFVQRLKDTAQALLTASDLRPNAERNWYILFGEALPA